MCAQQWILGLLITVITVINLSTVHCEKYRYCTVDGKGNFKRSARYCPILNKPDSKVKCIFGEDRLDCLRKISKKQADFGVFTSEDLISATSSQIEILITNEIRFTDEKYEYKVVAVVDKKAGITSRHDLQDKRFCHPGYGYESEWTRILSNYLEVSVVPQNCNPDKTLTENRIKSTSEFFSSACKAGPWVKNSTLDYELKRKYPNLCSTCDNPNRCSKEDKYWGRRGLLLCLTDGAGDISWARWDDVQIHFGLVPGGSEATPEGYNLLCPDDTVRPLNTTNPCVWVVKPWSVVATERSKAQDIQEMISALTHEDNYSWQSALLNLMESYHITIKPVVPIDPIETYLDKATGFLSANSFSGCHPPRTIKICTTSIMENHKCAWLREAAASYGIQPDLDCVRAANTTECMEAVQKGYASIVMVEPDSINLAQNSHDLKTIFYETVTDDAKYLTVAITKNDTKINSFDDLKGAKACFPKYDGVAWNTVAYILSEDDLLDSCPFAQGMADFFGDSCVPGLPKNESIASLSANCKGDEYQGDMGAIQCLIDGSGDVAFVSKNDLKAFLSDNEKNKKKMNLSDFHEICHGPCILSWSPVGYGMVHKNASDLWIKDTLDVFFAIDDMFGKLFPTLTSPFTLFGRFNGEKNLIFHDVTSKLRSQPTLKDFDQMPCNYNKILISNADCKSVAEKKIISSSVLIFSLLLYVFFA